MSLYFPVLIENLMNQGFNQHEIAEMLGTYDGAIADEMNYILEKRKEENNDRNHRNKIRNSIFE